jgi:heat shock protein HtpX
MLERLDREELQGVIAHEMSHIRNYDIRFQTLVGILVGMIALIADFFLRWSFWGGMGRRREGGGSGGDQGQAIMMVVALVLAILAPLAAYAVQFAVSRRREYLADASAVELTRNPLGLARALNDIAADPRPLKSANRATAHLYVENPLKKTKEATGVFDTHPPVRQRIKVLLDMAHVGPEALGERPSGLAGQPVHAAAPGPVTPQGPGVAAQASSPPPPPVRQSPPPPSVPG